MLDPVLAVDFRAQKLATIRLEDAEQEREDRGLPLEPAASLYAWLLNRGARTALRPNERATLADLAWLPEDLRGAVESLFADGHRIPQESLGTRVLTAGESPFHPR